MNWYLEKILSDEFSFYRRRKNPDTKFERFGFECGDGWAETLAKIGISIASVNFDYVRLNRVRSYRSMLSIDIEIKGCDADIAYKKVLGLCFSSVTICEVCGAQSLSHHCTGQYPVKYMVNKLKVIIEGGER